MLSKAVVRQQATKTPVRSKLVSIGRVTEMFRKAAVR